MRQKKKGTAIPGRVRIGSPCFLLPIGVWEGRDVVTGHLPLRASPRTGRWGRADFPKNSYLSQDSARFPRIRLQARERVDRPGRSHLETAEEDK